jgi:hypothetical protein
LPTALRQIRRLGTARLSQPFYYVIGAGLLRLTGRSRIEPQYWQLRGLSITLSVLALAIGWQGTRLLFGPLVASGALAIASLHPQFLLTAITVNPDALLNVVGAFVWWQVARALTGARQVHAVTMIVVAALLAPFVKRSGLLISAVGLIFAARFAAATVRVTRRAVVMAAVAGGALVAVVSALVLRFSPLADLAVYWRNALDLTRPIDQMAPADILAFLRVSIDYAWLVAGWLRFPAPEPWLWIARIVTVAGFGSALVVTWRAAERAPLLAAWWFFTGQIVATIVVTFFTLGSPQGRLMFPVIAPASALLWIGLTNAVPRTVRVWAPAAVVSLAAVMDVTGVTAVLFPAYLPWG